MRILWHSYNPQSTFSYGVLSRRILPHLVDAGHEVIVAAMLSGVGFRPFDLDLDGRRIKIISFNSSGLIGELAGAVEADRTALCCDVHRIPPDVMERIGVHAWSPVHHDFETDSVLAGFRAAGGVAIYSDWGTRSLAQFGIEADHIPCPVDLDVYAPADKMEARRRRFREFGDYFLISMIGINRDFDSKGYSEALQAFAIFAGKHPEARLYLHTNRGGGMALDRMIERLGIAGRVWFPPEMESSAFLLGDDYMADLFNASDAFLNTSRWEGFGLPVLEAQACGVPVIAPAAHATEEIIFNGWPVSGQWMFARDSHKIFVCDVDSIVDALEESFTGRRARLRPAEVMGFDSKIIAGQIEAWLGG
jgi:glycosyltransferase involved in cell wall biosynthesis